MNERDDSEQTPRRSLAIRPQVTCHQIDYEVSDFSNLTLMLMAALGPEINRGCHFINPLYTVSSSEPTEAFFRKAIWARDGWIHRFMKDIHPRGLRDLSKQLSTANKALQISGVMYLKGTVVPPHHWKVMAQAVLNPDSAQITSTRRPVNLADFETPDGLQILSSTSRTEIQQNLLLQPKASLYITPALTLAVTRLTPTFLAKARDAENHWHGRLRLLLGKVYKALIRSTDLATQMLVFHGTLVADGQIYLPSCWPDQQPSQGKRLTVSPAFLGLDLPVQTKFSHEGATRQPP